MFENPEIQIRLNKYMYGPGGPIPFMEEEEVKCIQSYLKPEYIMLEVGAGSSTLYYSKFVKKYYSIEHMMNWYRIVRSQLRKYPEINKKVELVYIPSDLDVMSKEDSKIKYDTYIKYIDTINMKFDAVLIDGAARDLCAMNAYKHMNKDSILFFHDYYTDKYNECHWIEEHFDVIDKITTGKTLVVMKKKNENKSSIS